MPIDVSTDQVVAFRMRNHNLVDRAPISELTQVVGQSGLQDSPPGSAALALNARIRDLTPDRLTTALSVDKSLVTTWAMRGAPFLVPTGDAAVFTAGVLPPTKTARIHLIRGVEPSLERLSLGLDEITDLIRQELPDVLTGRQLTVTELGEEVAPRIARQLPPETRDIWDAEGPHAKGQPVGDAVVHFVLRILTLEGVLCLAPSAGRGSPFVLVEELLGHPFTTVDPGAARTELVRRYLHCYGPSTRAEFAAWLGITATDAKAWWDAIADDLEQVSVEGRHAWVLAEDLPSLSSGPAFPGAPDSPHVRLLPPHDPYTQCRDRGTIVDKVYHRQVWKPVGDPGVLLVNGRIAGVWRPKKKGRTLTVTVSPFQPLTPAVQDAVRSEADGLGPFRGVGRVTVNIEDAFTSR